jgi:hypothetical protein
MIYSVTGGRNPKAPLLDSNFSIGDWVLVSGIVYRLEDIILGKYFVLTRIEETLVFCELYEVLPDRTFSLKFSSSKEFRKRKNGNSTFEESHEAIRLNFVNESLKFVLREELYVGEKRYINRQSKINDTWSTTLETWFG